MTAQADVVLLEFGRVGQQGRPARAPYPKVVLGAAAWAKTAAGRSGGEGNVR